MPKVTLTYDFTDIDDEHAFRTAINGWKWQEVVWELKQYLRDRLKYEELDETTAAALGTVSDKLWELIDASRLEFE